MGTHPVKRLTAPDGTEADIDVLLAPLVEALWAARYQTVGSCQDLGESIGEASPRKAAYWAGYALLEVPVADGRRLVNAVRQRARFRPRMHWAAKGAWEMSIPVIADPRQGAAITPWMQVHFPCEQAGDLAAVIGAQGRR